MAPFNWDNGPPDIQPHSKAKLEVLRLYLRAYFDRLNVVPLRNEFKLDLVDGFSGGGVFVDGDRQVSGTPLIMLEEVVRAQVRLNAIRKKPLNIDCKCYFVDKKRSHTKYLEHILAQSSFDPDSYVVFSGEFESKADGIIREIKRRQPRAGRAIFLLDQTGFSQVQLGLVARILQDLPKAEVILTFAADVLINFLNDRMEMVRAVDPIGLTAVQIQRMLAEKEEVGGKALVQRSLREHIRRATGATYDTPFFIRPRGSRRALWLLHLSRHPTARDVMMKCHWDMKNTFEHYGNSDFSMLGWDSLMEPRSLPILDFNELDEQNMKDSLSDTLVHELQGLMLRTREVSVESIHHAFANRTAALFSHFDEVLLQLFQEEEVEIFTPDGKSRSHSRLQKLGRKDVIALPAQRKIFFGPSRIWRR